VCAPAVPAGVSAAVSRWLSLHSNTTITCLIYHVRMCVPLQVRVLLSRRSHRQEGFALRGSAVRAYTPYNPVPRDEAWYLFLVDPNNNAIWAWTKVGLCDLWGNLRGVLRVYVALPHGVSWAQNYHPNIRFNATNVSIHTCMHDVGKARYLFLVDSNNNAIWAWTKVGSIVRLGILISFISTCLPPPRLLSSSLTRTTTPSGPGPRWVLLPVITQHSRGGAFLGLHTRTHTCTYDLGGVWYLFLQFSGFVTLPDTHSATAALSHPAATLLPHCAPWRLRRRGWHTSTSA
jgi:hypothetical protein